MRAEVQHRRASSLTSPAFCSVYILTDLRLILGKGYKNQEEAGGRLRRYPDWGKMGTASLLSTLSAVYTIVSSHGEITRNVVPLPSRKDVDMRRRGLSCLASVR